MVSTSFAAPVGDVLDGKFRVTKEIGRGGMATVYAAENIGIGKQVAVKILSEDLVTSKTVTERFLREARAAAKIHSPYVCEVYDVGTYDDRPFIVMELLRGESLYDKLARLRQLPVDEAVRIAVQTAKGLKKAHGLGVVHRDLKPENIFLTEGDDGLPHTKLVDFGLAKFYESNNDQATARLTKEGALFGTPAYMSPEQAKGKGNVDQRSDLWALGCIVFEMLTGRTVWDVEQGVAMILAQIASSPLPSARSYRPELPPAFDQWLTKALARTAEARFQTADEFIQSLRSTLGPDEPLRVSPTTPDEPLSFAQHAPAPPDTSSGPVALPAPPAIDAGDAAPDSASKASKRRRRLWYAAAAFIVGGGVGGWFVAGRLGGGEPLAAEQTPYAELLAEGQGALADGDTEQSIASFKSAFDKGQGKVARSLLSHVTTFKESKSGKCALRGIGHPRPFDRHDESSKPGLLQTPEGFLSSWADKHTDDTATHGRTAWLDSALRRTSQAVDVTPEAHTVRDPELFKTGEGLGLLFWDFDGDRAGAYVRRLNTRGDVAGPATLLGGSSKKHPYYPAIAKDEDGSFWTVWVEPSRDRVFDLHVRKLSPKLEPISRSVAVTAHATPVSGKTQAARPSLAISGKLLVITYTLRRGSRQQLMMLRVGKEQAEKGPSVVPENRPETPGDEESDRFMGQVVSVSDKAGSHDQSTVRCLGGNCYVAWDDISNAGYLALVGADGSITWRRDLGTGSARPGLSLSRDGKGGMLAWFANKRVHVAPFDSSNIGEASVVGRVSAELQQPPPTLVEDSRRSGTWYVAWRGYEAAVPEPFIARVDCKD